MTQEDALNLLKMGHNVYLTGAAGAGKTYVLNQYISYLKWNNVNVGVTASTGIAATHLNGMTIHSWSGLGIKDSLTDSDLKKMLEKPHLRSKFQYTKVLIIDEISMLHGYRLDMLDKLCRAFIYSFLPFGGLQVIMCGDFFQLPPVTRSAEEDGSFAYESQIWNEMDLKVCYLSEQHRQSEDGILRVLNDIRSGTTNEDTLETLRGRYKQSIENFPSPTKLFTHNVNVDEINNEKLKEISGKVHTFITESKGNPDLCDLLKKSCLAPEALTLKKGALVMFVKNNYEKGYVNGTLGKVIDFESENNYPVVELSDGREIVASPELWMIQDENVTKAQISQVPLRLAWAITIHKSQGMSLDAAEIDLSKSFVPGMGYVALSRVKTLSGMKLTGFNDMALRVNKDVLQKDTEFMNSSMENELELSNMKKTELDKKIQDYLKSVSSKK